MAIRINGRVYKNWEKLTPQTVAKADRDQLTYDDKNRIREWLAFNAMIKSVKQYEKVKLARVRKEEKLNLDLENKRKKSEVSAWKGTLKSALEQTQGKRMLPNQKELKDAIRRTIPEYQVNSIKVKVSTPKRKMLKIKARVTDVPVHGYYNSNGVLS